MVTTAAGLYPFPLPSYPLPVTLTLLTLKGPEMLDLLTLFVYETICLWERVLSLVLANVLFYWYLFVFADINY